jgi:hypothetical protein
LLAADSVDALAAELSSSFVGSLDAMAYNNHALQLGNGLGGRNELICRDGKGCDCAENDEADEQNAVEEVV